MSRIIHLSDLHFSRNNEYFQFCDIEPAELADHVVAAIGEPTADIVVISGDLTWQADTWEFDLVESFLKSLLKRLKLTRQALLLTPGNHDMRWYAGQREASDEERTDCYRSFYRHLKGGNNGSQSDLSSYVCTRDITVVGLNSASLEAPEPQKRGLGIVTESQLKDVMRRLLRSRTFNASAPKVAVLHHHLLPVTWLEPDLEDKRYGLVLDTEAIQTRLMESGFDLVLHGHQHQPFLRVVQNPVLEGATPLVISGAGSFGVAQRHIGDTRRNHFQVIDLESTGMRIAWCELSHDRPYSFKQSRVFRHPKRPAVPARKRLFVGISGTMGVGKTTLAKLVEAELVRSFPETTVHVVREVARKLIETGITQDKETTFDDYAAYVSGHLSRLNSVTTRINIFDRTILDTLAYAIANRNVAEPWMKVLEEIAKLYSKAFDVYIYVPMEECVPLMEDGLRNTDIRYQREVDNAMQEVLTRYMPGYLTVRGTPEERANQALKHLKPMYLSNH